MMIFIVDISNSKRLWFIYMFSFWNFSYEHSNPKVAQMISEGKREKIIRDVIFLTCKREMRAFVKSLSYVRSDWYVGYIKDEPCWTSLTCYKYLFKSKLHYICSCQIKASQPFHLPVNLIRERQRLDVGFEDLERFKLSHGWDWCGWAYRFGISSWWHW